MSERRDMHEPLRPEERWPFAIWVTKFVGSALVVGALIGWWLA